MNTRALGNTGEIKHASHDFLKSRKAIFKIVAIVTFGAAALSLSACGGASPGTSQAGATQSPSASASPTRTPTPTPTATAPRSTSCVTENATESYPPKVYICTKSDAGALLWMESSESKRVTDARAAAAAAAAKAAADKAAADKAAADAAAAHAAAQAKADADATAAKAQQDQAQARQVQQQAPSSVYYKNCTAARAAGAAPIYRGQPGYRPELDRDGDGIACE